MPIRTFEDLECWKKCRELRLFVAKGLCKNYFRFWRERHRARCEARGRECIL